MTLAEALALAERDDLLYSEEGFKQYREAAKVLASEVWRLRGENKMMTDSRNFWREQRDRLMRIMQNKQ